MLDLLLPDPGAVQKVLAEGLRSARREKLPEDPWELLRFVKIDLAAPLKKMIPASLVVALVDDLAEEIDRRPRHDEDEAPPTLRRPPSQALRAAATRSVREPERSSRMPSTQRLPPAKGDAAARTATRAPTRKARPIAPPGSEKPPPTVRAPSVPPAAEESGPAAVVVDSDGLARAALARELFKAKLDVSAFATVAEAGAALRSRDDLLVLIVDARQIDIESVEALAYDHPTLRVVIKADTASRSARSMLTAAGVESFVVLAKGTTASEIVAATRKILATDPHVAPPPPSVRGGPRSRR
jgi:hypothetical protein